MPDKHTVTIIPFIVSFIYYMYAKYLNICKYILITQHTPFTYTDALTHSRYIHTYKSEHTLMTIHIHIPTHACCPLAQTATGNLSRTSICNGISTHNGILEIK